MAYQISAKRLQEVISKATLLDDGDQHERANCLLLRDTFPNFEVYWKHFVVPFTKRIEGIKDPNECIRHRDGVHQEIKDLGIVHYSVFLNLVYANNHLQNPGLSSFEDFYIHLVAACDLAEEFLTHAYLLILGCRGQECVVLQRLSREDFLIEAGKWYDKRYSTLYEHYRYRRKIPPIDLPPNKENILDECFLSAEPWRKYKKFSLDLRTYRNALVHRSHMMRILDLIKGEKTRLVPRKARVPQYKTWTDIEAARRDRGRIEDDFVPMKEQMRSDIEQLTTLLNGIWSKPVEDMRRLLCEDRNAVLLAKYDLVLK